MPPGPLELSWLGRRSHAEAWAEQRARAAAIAEGKAPEAIWLLEHDPIVTLGRQRAAAANVLSKAAGPVVAIERGGDATWHGPGQLVAYVLLRLEGPERDLHAHLRRLEGWCLEVLARFGLEGRREPSATGVWVQDRKLASLGIAVKRWVTYHGLALNVAPDMTAFHHLRPCGLEASVMASMAELLGPECPSLEAVAAAFAATAEAHWQRPLAGWPAGLPRPS